MYYFGYWCIFIGDLSCKTMFENNAHWRNILNISPLSVDDTSLFVGEGADGSYQFPFSRVFWGTTKVQNTGNIPGGKKHGSPHLKTGLYPMPTETTGAEAALLSSVQAGLEVCFANPGTTEMWFVGALDTVHGIRPVLGLHETVCTGACDGYGRMKRKPAGHCSTWAPDWRTGYRTCTMRIGRGRRWCASSGTWRVGTGKLTRCCAWTFKRWRRRCRSGWDWTRGLSGSGMTWGRL